MKIISQNKRAKRDYEIQSEFDAGISLLGSEIKSIRNGDITVDSAFVGFDGKIPLMKNVNIGEYEFSNNSHDPLRDRPLLLNKAEIKKLMKSKEEKGLSIIVLSIYLSSKGIAKAKIAVAKGRNKSDKREYEKEKDFKKEKRQYM